MIKIVFLGAGSTVFCKNLIGDCMISEHLCDAEFALYDINEQRLFESKLIVDSLNKSINVNRAVITTYLGVENRKAALSGANFIINAILIGGYPEGVTLDFEIPKKYGLKQTIADTLGIGGIMRALRTIPVMQDIAEDIQECCPNALMLNYTNPMSIITGYMQRYTKVNTVGLCHSVQVCSKQLLEGVGMAYALDGKKDLIAGINHMAWLLDIRDKHGNDLYPEIKRRALLKNETEKHNDMVRYEYIKHLGYYCTESSEHNAEYNAWFIKKDYPELIEKFNIPIDEYLYRCEKRVKNWSIQKQELLDNAEIQHKRTDEYASYIMEAIVSNNVFRIGANVINNGLIQNLPDDACVELPCMVDSNGINPTFIGRLPVHLAALNMTNINVHLMTIQAAVTRDIKDIYRAVMLDPLCAANLSIDDMIAMTDELIQEHNKLGFMKEYV